MLSERAALGIFTTAQWETVSTGLGENARRDNHFYILTF